MNTTNCIEITQAAFRHLLGGSETNIKATEVDEREACRVCRYYKTEFETNLFTFESHLSGTTQYYIQDFNV